jgi:integrase/recombinase XerD
MIFDTILYTGLRREELTKIRRDDVLIEKITVHDGKWGRKRNIYLPRHYSEELQLYLAETRGLSEYLFFSDRTYGKFNPDSISNIFTRISEKCGRRVYPHLIRHDYASNCVQDGVNIYSVSQNLGHSDVKTTSIYLYMNDVARYDSMQLLK